jgi:hypothetical protein
MLQRDALCNDSILPLDGISPHCLISASKKQRDGMVFRRRL